MKKKILEGIKICLISLIYSAIILFIVAILCKLLVSGGSKKETKKEEKVYIEMDAVTEYSCKDYSIFSSAEFTSFVVFDQPLREYYDPVVLVIDTKNTSNTIDDEVIKVKNRNCTDINSTGGDIYGYYYWW